MNTPLPFCRPVMCWTERQAKVFAGALIEARIAFEFEGLNETTNSYDFAIRGADYSRACELAQLVDKPTTSEKWIVRWCVAWAGEEPNARECEVYGADCTEAARTFRAMNPTYAGARILGVRLVKG